MRVSRRTLLVILLIVTAWLGCSRLRDHMEVATLFIRGRNEDFYTRLWVVDAPPHVWIRAERPDRMWLKGIRENPNVSLTRGDRVYHLRAVVWNGKEAHEQVDRLFRAKYGLLDVIAGFLWRRDSVPIRLEPR